MTERIFVVDDEPSMIQLCTILLQREGLSVVGTAFDGEEAVNKFRELKEPPDMVLLDHRMPRKNGLDTMRELLIIQPGLKVLFVSADLSVRSLAYEGGAADFLPKPFSISEFIHIVRKVLLSEDRESGMA